MEQQNTRQTEKILFINGSPNHYSNTAALAKELLEGKDMANVPFEVVPVTPLDTVFPCPTNKSMHFAGK